MRDPGYRKTRSLERNRLLDCVLAITTGAPSVISRVSWCLRLKMRYVVCKGSVSTVFSPSALEVLEGARY